MGIAHAASGTEMVFWAIAVFGTLFFLLRAVLMVLGGLGAEVGGHHGEVPVGHGDAGLHHGSHDTTDSAFKLISLNSLTGFFMMFGWAGLAAYNQFRLGSALSFLIAFGVGLLSMYATAYVFKVMMQLNSPGERFVIDRTVGLNASVYLKVPANGTGRIQVVYEGTPRLIDAVADDGGEIESFTDVSIVRVVDFKTVAVKKK